MGQYWPSPGPPGPSGGIGPQGVQGPQGIVGTQGSQGFTGPQGVQGVLGPSGPQGTQGSIGNTGPQGVQGTVGNTGPQGSTGATGNQGSQGSTGAQGVQGAAGGGPQGPQGYQGNIGGPGTQGVQGVQGTQGVQGPLGNTGPTGPQGNQGPQGAGVAPAVMSGQIAADIPIAANTGTSIIQTGTILPGTYRFRGQCIVDSGTAGQFVILQPGQGNATASFSILSQTQKVWQAANYELLMHFECVATVTAAGGLTVGIVSNGTCTVRVAGGYGAQNMSGYLLHRLA